MKNLILSSSLSLLIDDKHWLRKEEYGNIFWLPSFTDYYYSYRAFTAQWWYASEHEKYAIGEMPSVEKDYQSTISLARYGKSCL